MFQSPRFISSPLYSAQKHSAGSCRLPLWRRLTCFPNLSFNARPDGACRQSSDADGLLANASFQRPSLGPRLDPVPARLPERLCAAVHGTR